MANDKNALVARQPFSAVINSPAMQKSIMNTLGSEAKSKKFTASIVSAYNATPALRTCTPQTVIGSALLGEALNLSPSPTLGKFYLVPFGNKNNPDLYNADGSVALDDYGKPKKMQDAQFILGYKGYIELAIRSGAYEKIKAMEVREGEFLGLDEDGDPVITFISDVDVRAEKPVVGYMATLKTVSGFKKTIYWSKNQMLLHANRYSKAFDIEAYNLIQEGKMSKKDMWKYSSYWYANFDGMAMKTMLRQLLSTWGILSVELQTALNADMGVVNEDGDVIDYPDNPQNDTPSYEVSDDLKAQKDEQIIAEYKFASKHNFLTTGQEEQVLLNNKVLSYKALLELQNHPIAQEKVLDILECGYENASVDELQTILRMIN
jgi:recombination protein RecT